MTLTRLLPNLSLVLLGLEEDLPSMLQNSNTYLMLDKKLLPIVKNAKQIITVVVLIRNVD